MSLWDLLAYHQPQTKSLSPSRAGNGKYNELVSDCRSTFVILYWIVIEISGYWSFKQWFWFRYFIGCTSPNFIMKKEKQRQAGAELGQAQSNLDLNSLVMGLGSVRQTF